jgi:hypothetical protein
MSWAIVKQSPPPLKGVWFKGAVGQPTTPANITTGTPAASCTIWGRSRRPHVIVVPSVKTTVVLYAP